MIRGRKPHAITAAALTKRKEQEKMEKLYYAERKKLFIGDEEFMNTLHPFEDSKKGCGKKSSPFQKALIACINENNGYATEQQLLDYVVKKWDIIVKYTPRAFISEPSIRVIRLNLSVRKKARHLFLKHPELPDTWIINSSPRKNPPKRTLFRNTMIDESSEEDEKTSSEIEAPIESEPDVINESYIMHKDTFERYVEDYMKSVEGDVKLEDIALQLSKFKDKAGLFKCLPLERRVRACLIVLKSEGRVFFDEKTNTWSNQKKPLIIEKSSENNNRLT